MYFCEKCKEAVNKEEISVIEGYYEGDWVEVHTKCNEEVKFI